jgi:hypothetical protein
MANSLYDGQGITSPEYDKSLRIFLRDLSLIQPFTDLSFDTLAKKASLDGSWDLERVSADSDILLTTWMMPSNKQL